MQTINKAYGRSEMECRKYDIKRIVVIFQTINSKIAQKAILDDKDWSVNSTLLCSVVGVVTIVVVDSWLVAFNGGSSDLSHSVSVVETVRVSVDSLNILGDWDLIGELVRDLNFLFIGLVNLNFACDLDIYGVWNLDFLLVGDLDRLFEWNLDGFIVGDLSWFLIFLVI